MGTGVFFSILRRVFLLPPGYVESGKPLEELEPVYRRWELLSLPLMLVLIPPLTATWWWILYLVGIWNAQRHVGAVYHLWPVGVTWGTPAFLLAVISEWLPMTLIYRRCLRERYVEFERYLHLRHRYNQAPGNGFVFASVTAIVLVTVVLILHYRTLLTKDEIIHYPFFSLSSVRHKYTDITEIRTAPQRRAPNGKLRGNDDYEVDFADGSMWSTYPNPAALATAEKRQMMEFVSKQSGKPIRRVPVLERGR